MYTALSRRRRVGIVSAGALVATAALLVPAYAMASGASDSAQPEACQLTIEVPADGTAPDASFELLPADQLADLEAELATATSGEGIDIETLDDSNLPECAADWGLAGR